MISEHGLIFVNFEQEMTPTNEAMERNSGKFDSKRLSEMLEAMSTPQVLRDKRNSAVNGILVL